MKLKMMELFKKAFEIEKKSKGEMRYGQSLMNALAEIDIEAYRDISEKNMTVGSIDPFYTDKHVNKFLNYLDDRWD